MKRFLYVVAALAVLVGAVLIIGAPANAACTELSGTTEVWCEGQLPDTGGTTQTVLTIAAIAVLLFVFAGLMFTLQGRTPHHNTYGSRPRHGRSTRR